MGYVIIEVPYLVKDSKDGLDMQHNSSITIGDWTVRSGVVYSVHENTDNPDMNMLFDSPLQVAPGNKVWWHPNAVQQLANDPYQGYRIMTHGGRLFVSIPYKFLIMKLAGGEYVGLNDYVITEPLKRTSDVFDVDFLSVDGFRHRVVAAPLEGVTYKSLDGKEETPVRVKPGMEVVLRQPRKMFIEHEGDYSLPGRWCAFQSRYILGVTNEVHEDTAEVIGGL